MYRHTVAFPNIGVEDGLNIPQKNQFATRWTSEGAHRGGSADAAGRSPEDVEGGQPSIREGRTPGSVWWDVLGQTDLLRDHVCMMDGESFMLS